jgi:hypothetical protein
MIPGTPVTCASGKDALILMVILILNVPLEDTQASTVAQNFNASLTMKEAAWLGCMTVAVHGRTEDGN